MFTKDREHLRFCKNKFGDLRGNLSNNILWALCSTFSGICAEMPWRCFVVSVETKNRILYNRSWGTWTSLLKHDLARVVFLAFHRRCCSFVVEEPYTIQYVQDLSTFLSRSQKNLTCFQCPHRWRTHMSIRRLKNYIQLKTWNPYRNFKTASTGLNCSP